MSEQIDYKVAGFNQPTPIDWLEDCPPFQGMQVKILEWDGKWNKIYILLPLNKKTRNPGGSMFGGCMASLADPIAALACAWHFQGYSVWTRNLSLDFLREGSTDLELRFEFDPIQKQEIAKELAQRDRSTPLFEYAYYLPDGSVCAQVQNRVAIRKKGYVAGSSGAL